MSYTLVSKSVECPLLFGGIMNVEANVKFYVDRQCIYAFLQCSQNNNLSLNLLKHQNNKITIFR